jgi:hypothetical protein
MSRAPSGKRCIVESTSKGVAIFHYNNDGLPDIFVVNGGRLDDQGKAPHFLYHNLDGLNWWLEI